MDFACVLLMCLAGGRLVNVPTPVGEKTYAYLRYEHPTDMASGQRVRLGRIIIDAPPDKAVGFAGRGAFRDYRRSNLKLRKPIKSMKDPELGREEAIKLARALYEVNPIAGLTYLSRTPRNECAFVEDKT